MGRIFPIANWGAAPSSLLTGLAAYYPLGEASGNRADSLGANPLTPTGSPGNAAGKVGNAIALDGTAKYAECADSAALDFTTAMSISMWLYPAVLTNFMCPISKWSYKTDGEWMIDVLNTGSIRFSPATYATDPVDGVATTPAGLMVASTWLHVVWLYDGTQTGNAARLRLYANGAPITLSFAGTTIPATLRNGSAPLRVGAWSGSLTRYFNGRVDELGLWNRALTTGEVAALYNGGAGVTYPF